MKKSNSRRRSENYAKALRADREQRKQAIKAEHERYKNPPNPFCIGDKVILKHFKRKDIYGEVIKINIKTYTVKCEIGNKYRIDKFSLNSMWTELLDGVGYDNRQRIGESVTMKKMEPKDY